MSEKDQRKRDKTLEFIWRGSSSLGKDAEMFTHVMDSHYCTPAEMNFERNVINGDDNLPTYPTDVGEVVQSFLKMARARSEWYRHDQVLLPYGCDFSHQNAFKSFRGMDTL